MLLMEEAVSRSDKAETGRMQEKRGYSVFGKEYEQMLRHDLHAENSIDHQLLRRMVLLEEDTAARLYSQKGSLPAGIHTTRCMILRDILPETIRHRASTICCA